MRDGRTIFELMTDMRKVFDMAGRELVKRADRFNRAFNKVFSGKKTESGGLTLDEIMQKSRRIKSYPSWEEGLKYKEMAFELQNMVRKMHMFLGSLYHYDTGEWWPYEKEPNGLKDLIREAEAMVADPNKSIMETGRCEDRPPPRPFLDNVSHETKGEPK